jgi:23S rRNA (guanosine2251-2'-O)-methyltransferase
MAEWIYGRRTVKEQLDALPGSCELLLLAEGAEIPHGIKRSAEAAGVKIDRQSRDKIEQLTDGGNHQGVCLRVKSFEYVDIDIITARLARPAGEGTPLIFALDCVQDPRNLGAVLRVADAVGAAGVIIPKDRAAGVTAYAARSAAGAAAVVPVAQVTNLARTLTELDKERMWIIGASHKATHTIFETRVNAPTVLVLGSEEKGMRPNVEKRCHSLAALPMMGQVDSLNISVAAGAMAYEVYRQLNA